MSDTSQQRSDSPIVIWNWTMALGSLWVRYEPEQAARLEAAFVDLRMGTIVQAVWYDSSFQAYVNFDSLIERTLDGPMAGHERLVQRVEQARAR